MAYTGNFSECTTRAEAGEFSSDLHFCVSSVFREVEDSLAAEERIKAAVEGSVCVRVRL